LSIKGNHLDQVIDLLNKGTELKLFQDNSAEAERILRKAHDLTESNKIPKPWPQLVSYRLAHVLMRRAKSKKDILEIDQLFNIAAISDCLGPLPRIYRLAAMSRSGAKNEDMKVVFDKLLDQINRFTENHDSSDRYDRMTALQNNYFNMLELAAYFTGYPYVGFEGKGRIEKGDPYSDLYSKMENWKLVGTIPGLASTAYPGEMAFEEIEDRMDRSEIKPPCVAFRISENFEIHEWNFNLKKKDGIFEWIKIGKESNHIKLLFSIFRYKEARTRGDFLMRMFNYDEKPYVDVLRQWKLRCAKAIRIGLQGTGNGLSFKNNIFLDDRLTDRPVPEFQTGISILGAIDNNLGFFSISHPRRHDPANPYLF